MAERFFVKVVTHDTEAPSSVRWSETDGSQEAQATRDASVATLYRLPDFPADRPMLVHIERNHGVRLTTQLHLSKTGESRFVWGRPSIMTLLTSGRTDKDTTLKVDLYPPQEVILCVGAHWESWGRSPGFWGQTCLRRIGVLAQKLPSNLDAGLVHVNPSCVYTVLEFNGQAGSKMHHLLSGRGDVASLPGNGDASQMPRTAVSMGQFAFPLGRDFLSANDFYAYLARTGRLRPGTVMAIEMFGHAYTGGPVMDNTSRERPVETMSDERRLDLFAHMCRDACPTTTVDWERPWMNPHGALPYQMPRHFANLEYDPSSRTLRPRSAIRCIAREEVPPPIGAPHRSRASYAVRNRDGETRPEDIDFRHTDFFLFGQENLQHMRDAVHADCITRVYGCAGGDDGARYRRLSALESLFNGPDNELIRIQSWYHGHAQEWCVRRRDANLTFLSQCRRIYGQAMATALNRPCYAPIPGTTTDQDTTTRIRAQKIERGLLGNISRISRRWIPDEFEHRDEAGYARWVPRPRRTDIPLTILVTGFAPFGGETVNASTQAVLGMTGDAIRQLIHVPPWVNLTLGLVPLTNVDVVWTCRAAYGDPAGVPPGGGRGIIRHIRGMEGSGPDIVLVVGESNRLATWRKPIRLECYARNLADVELANPEGMSHVEREAEMRRQLTDNVGKMLPHGTSLFSDEPYYLETSVPRFVWGSAMARYWQHGVDALLPEYVIRDTIHGRRMTIPDPTSTPENFREVNPAGGFVCNETYYSVLRESYYRGQSHPPSGRWVVMAHVAAYRSAPDLAILTRALNVTVASLCEDMLWASVFHGKVAPVQMDAGSPNVINGRGGATNPSS
jgi:pyrrolidone-carboxylate peptidase